MIRLIAAERLKYRRSFARRLALGAPLFFALYGAVVRFLLPEDGTNEVREVLLAMIFNWWTVLFVPFGVALLGVLAENRERKAGRYRGLLANPVHPAKLWLSRIVVLGYYQFMASVVLIAVAIAAAGLIPAGGGIPLAAITEAGLLAWLSSFGLAPVHLYAAFRFGTLPALALGTAGMIAGVVAAPEPYWIAVPWSWPIRLMAPVIGVHPNGVMLPLDDPLRDAAAIPAGILASMLFLVLTSALTAALFARREVR
ncbi:MAG: multidrug ABC transporter permease [Thermobacillus sp. ZCTH02-B1]|uniref:lantibiotic immunity ABC transporter MutE/EpiE family permease subunit n=1 Tax=Thermobacillus sp. ZCTH02-B1 TaxID=1858795 RepID=UPI000B570DE1|nr:lantibiotic immunity ABC transporter MutE/EpiE family permease subunit [Thermobacillus sp. ZCTH02-B1]OUM95597.1 MAG: multidrug ABC transporter permease [Thermobacillus sp. ZCTH02-B1]